MKNVPIQTTNEDAGRTANSSTNKKFVGTDKPRDLRAITALLTRPQPREHLDRAAGCSNSPDLISKLRCRGLEIPCNRIDYIDRDGRLTHPGVYYFSDTDRRKVNKWIAERDRHGC